MICLKQQAIEALESANDYLTKMINAIPDIIKAYRVGELNKASSDMILLSEGLQWLNEVFNLTKDFHNVNNIEIKEVYFEFVEAFENDDSVLLADLLEYELLPKIQHWKDILNESLASYAN